MNVDTVLWSCTNWFHAQITTKEMVYTEQDTTNNIVRNEIDYILVNKWSRRQNINYRMLMLLIKIVKVILLYCDSKLRLQQKIIIRLKLGRATVKGLEKVRVRICHSRPNVSILWYPCLVWIVVKTEQWQEVTGKETGWLKLWCWQLLYGCYGPPERQMSNL